MSITKATLEDVPALVELINSAYRGEFSKKGWTSEADLLVGGKRVDEIHMTNMILKKGSMVLKHVTATNQITGCVYLEAHGDHMYLGTLTVSPVEQAKGIGKQLLKASEEEAVLQGKEYIIMTVITVRPELIGWYNRHGYVDTGIRKPFPHEPWQGRPSQPLEFMVLKKMVR